MQSPSWWTTYVTEVTDTVETESAKYVASTPRGQVVLRTFTVLVVSAVSLLFINTSRRGDPWLSSTNAEFGHLVRWALVSIFGYVVFPVLTIKLILKKRIRDFGLRFRGIGGSWKVYVLLYGLSVPFILFASTQANFLATYPFYSLIPGEAWWPYLWLWWGLYAAQFVALEFFFRGFMVHGLKLRMGVTSVFVMVVPYVMVHFAKPPLEALSAIVGGTVLGYLSLKTKSVWWGAGVHIAIAATMDLLALGSAGLL
jgi:membrane protease YdiL (CAAX protease family)